MFDLFKTTKFFELETQDLGTVRIELTAFTRVQNGGEDSHPASDCDNSFLKKTFLPQYNLCLYCSDYRLLLFQFGSDEPIESQKSLLNENPNNSNWQYFSIPIDKAKGAIVSMCWNADGTRLCAITERSIIYIIPFGCRSFYDPYSKRHRQVLEEDAKLIKSCELTNPTSIVWWQRDPRFAVQRRSIAIVGSESGILCLIDLETDEKFQKYSIPFSIQSLSLYREMYGLSLLITCHQGFQYQLILEENRNFLSAQNRSKNIPPPTTSDDSLLNNLNNYYLWCLLGSSFENDSDVASISSDEQSIKTINQPQLILFDNEIDFNTKLMGIKSTQSQDAVTSAAEFLFFTDESPSSWSSTESNISLHPPTITSNIHVIKHRNLKMKTSPIFSSGSSGLDADNESIGSNDSDDFQMMGCSKYSSKSLKSDFCNISICNDQILEIYEYDSGKFCTKTISFSSGRLFMVSLNQDNLDFQTNFIRLVDLSYRFLLLVFKDRCILVSKTFAEQTKSASASSPRSPLLLKRSDSTSFRSPNEPIGSFRRKHASTSQHMPTPMSVIDQFEPVCDLEHDQIINVFPVKPCADYCGIKEYLQRKLYVSENDAEFAQSDLNDLQEDKLIELLASPQLNYSTVSIDENFLIISRKSVYLVESKGHSFGEFFHDNIGSLLHSQGQSGQNQQHADGDIISRAKTLVDCLATDRSSHQNSFISKDSLSALIPSQSWQLWLFRSALLIMSSLFQDSNIEKLSQEKKTRVLSIEHQREKIISKKLIEKIDQQMFQATRLMELSRCSRRRVVSAFVHFKFWAKSIQQLQRFFRTRIIFELNDEERCHLSGQLFESLLAVYKFYSGLSTIDKCPDDDYYRQKSEKDLYRFFYENRLYYDPEKLLKRLVNLNLLDMAEYVALLSGDYLHLIHFILKKYPLDESMTLTAETKEKILYLLTTNRVTDALIVSVDYLDGCRSISMIESYLQFIFALLPKLDFRFLRRLAKIFDPSRISVWFLLNQTLFYSNQTYLCSQCPSEVDSVDSTIARLTSSDSEVSLITSNGELRKNLLPIKKRDLLNLHIFIQSLCLRDLIRRNKEKSIYHWSLVQTITEFIRNHRLNYQKRLVHSNVIEPNYVEDKNFCDWQLAAGTYCSLTYNADCFYLWGKFSYKFSCSEQFVRNFSPNAGRQDSDRSFKSSSIHIIEAPTLNRFFSSVINAPIQSISIGHHHMMILTSNALFGLGSSSFGQLGLGHKVLSSPYPASLNLSHCVKFRKVVCGSYHTLALSHNGHLYSFGWALYGQLGHGSIEDQFQPKLIDYLAHHVKVKIVDMAAGYCHTVALTINGELYVFGGNSNGQLGIEPDLLQNDSPGTNKYTLPQKFSLLNEPIELVCCGLFHTAVITAKTFDPILPNQTDGNRTKLFCWGIDPKTLRMKMRSDRSSTGNNSQQSTRLIKSSKQSVWDYAKIREINLSKLKAGSSVTKMSAGQSHTLLLTDQSYLYVFGYGQLAGTMNSLNSSTYSWDEAIPMVMMEGEIDIRFVDIACGAVHFLALDSKGNVWGWGQSSQNQLRSASDDDFDQAGHGHKRTSPSLSSGRSLAMVNNLILSSPKNCQRSPSIVLSLNKGISFQPEKNSSFDDFTGQPTPKLFKQKLSVETLCKRILLTIIYNDQYFNLKSLIKRFERLNLHQLCSFIAWLSNDHIKSWRFQLEALFQENFSHKSIFIDNLCKLLSFYLWNISSSNFSQSTQSELTRKLMKILISFWTKVVENNSLKLLSSDFEIILKNVYLEDNPANDVHHAINPHFGLQLLSLFKTLQNDTQQDLSKSLGLNDQILIAIVQRTQTLLRDFDKFPIIQEFFDQVSNLKSFFHDGDDNFGMHVEPNSEYSKRIVFPLELRWQQLMIGLDKNFQPNPFCDALQSEICIPSDIELDEDLNDSNDQSLLFIFKCGHYISQRKFCRALEQLFENEDIVKKITMKKSCEAHFESFKLIHQKFTTAKHDPQTSLFDSKLSNEIENLVCLNCCFPDFSNLS